MRETMSPRLCDLASADNGNQDKESRNLGSVISLKSVHGIEVFNLDLGLMLSTKEFTTLSCCLLELLA